MRWAELENTFQILKKALNWDITKTHRKDSAQISALAEIIHLIKLNRLSFLEYHFLLCDMNKPLEEYSSKKSKLASLQQRKRKLEQETKQTLDLKSLYKGKVGSKDFAEELSFLEEELRTRKSLSERVGKLEELCKSKKAKLGQSKNFVNKLSGELHCLKTACEKVVSVIGTEEGVTLGESPNVLKLPFPLLFLYHSAKSLEKRTLDLMVSLSSKQNLNNSLSSSLDDNKEKFKNESKIDEENTLVILDFKKAGLKLAFIYEKDENKVYLTPSDHKFSFVSLYADDKGSEKRFLNCPFYNYNWCQEICGLSSSHENPKPNTNLEKVIIRIINRVNVTRSLSHQMNPLSYDGPSLVTSPLINKTLPNAGANSKKWRTTHKQCDGIEIELSEFARFSKEFLPNGKRVAQLENEGDFKACRFLKLTFRTKDLSLLLHVCLFPDYPLKKSLFTAKVIVNDNSISANKGRKIDCKIPLKNYINLNDGKSFENEYENLQIEESQFEDNLIEELNGLDADEGKGKEMLFYLKVKYIDSAFFEWVKERGYILNNSGERKEIGFFNDRRFEN